MCNPQGLLEKHLLIENLLFEHPCLCLLFCVLSSAVLSCGSKLSQGRLPQLGCRPSCDMEAPSLRQLAEWLGKASAILSKEKVLDAMKMCEILKAHFQRKVRSLLARAAGRPVLFSYSCDGTPMKIAVRVSSEGLAPNDAVNRRGRSCVEFLLQRGWYKTVGPEGNVLMCALLADPIPLSHGKSSWYLYAAAEKFAPLTQSLGHEGICVTHYAFDRAVFSALTSKRFRQHEQYHERRKAKTITNRGPPTRCLDWAVGTGCAMRDAQNGLKWALARSTESGDVVRDLHICIESLRNSFLMLHSHLRPFLREANIGFDHEPYNRDHVYEFWVALGVGGDVVETFVDVNPWFSGGRLWVSGEWEGNEELEENLSRMILYLLKLKRFTESRWCTIGPSCRALVACLACGLEFLVAIARKDPRTSEFYISGFSRLTQQVKQYAVLAALVSYVPDSFLLELMEDDRVASRLAAFEAVMIEELGWLDKLSPLTWQRLAHVAGSDTWPSQEVRTDVLLGGHLACSYITDKVLTVARGMPWCLARGEVDQKLRDLASMSTPPDDDTATKIHTLLREGNPW